MGRMSIEQRIIGVLNNSVNPSGFDIRKLTLFFVNYRSSLINLNIMKTLNFDFTIYLNFAFAFFSSCYFILNIINGIS